MLQYRSNFHSVLAKTLVKKQVNSYCFLTLRAFRFVHFKTQGLHFAPFCLSSLVANSLFFTPKYTIFAPKTPLFDGYFALSSHVFHDSKTLYLYHHGGFLCLSSRIQQQIALHLAAKYLAFSTKTPCVLHQNAMCFAAYCTVSCCKQAQNWYKWRFF